MRDLLEQLQSPEIEDGIRVELFNGRGVDEPRRLRWRRSGAGPLAANYAEQAKNVAGRWPRTAALLGDLGAELRTRSTLA